MSGATSDDKLESAPWRDRRFLIFAAGNFINNLGEATYKVALPLYVYDLTGSLTAMSLLAALGPAMLLLGPWLGVIVDRWGPRVFVVPGLLVQILATVWMNVVATQGHISTYLLFFLAAINQVGGEMYRSGWITGVPVMFPHNAARSRSALSTLFVTSTVIGPLIVAVGLDSVGYLGLLWFNAATFVAPIIVWVAGIRPVTVPRRIRVQGLSFVQDIAAGWRIINDQKEALYIQLVSLPLQFVSGIGVLSFMVWYLRDELLVPAADVSAIQAALSLGAFVGSAYVATKRRVRFLSDLSISAMAMAVALWLTALPFVWAFTVGLVALFSFRSVVTAISAAAIVKCLPAEVVGRAEGLFNLLNGLPLLLAPLVIPVIQENLGSAAVLITLSLVASLSPLMLLQLRDRWRVQDQAN